MSLKSKYWRIPFLCLLTGALLHSDRALRAQYNNIWIFGQSYGTGDGKLAGLDFSSIPPQPFTYAFERVGSVNIFGETTAGIANEDGRLLFATDGYHIWNRKGQLMPNGRGVSLRNIDTISLNASHVGSAAQGSIIVKVPCEEDLYYVFSVAQNELFGQFGDLYYSMVDMQLANGMGDVQEEKKGMLLRRGYTEHMTVVQGKGNYLWLLLLQREGSDMGLHAYKITIKGIDTIPVVSDIGAIPNIGWMVGNHKADKLAVADFFGVNVKILDFDNSSGKAIYSTVIREFSRPFGPYGAAFAPNDSLLYVTINGQLSGELYQFEVYNNFRKHVLLDSTRHSAIQEGPDGRLYFLGQNQGRETLHTIHYPNRIGTACGIAFNTVSYDTAITLHLGLPNTIGVFKSPKRISTRARHIIEELTCGRPLTLSSTDTLPDKTTLWNTGAEGSAINIDKSGVYVAHSMSNSACMEHIDSFFVHIPEPEIVMHIQPACPTVDNGKARIEIRHVDARHIRNLVWYDTDRDQVLGYDDSLANLPAGRYWLRVQYTTCDTLIEVNIPRLTDRVSFYADSFICASSVVQIEHKSIDRYPSFWWYKDDNIVDSHRHLVIALHDTGLFRIALIGKMEHCFDTLVRQVRVDPRLSAEFVASADSICTGQAITFRPQVQETMRALHWTWAEYQFASYNAEPISHAFDEAGTQPVRLRTTYRACPDAKYTKNIYVSALPQVFLGNDSSICYQGKTILLENHNGLSAENYIYRWSTGDTSAQLHVSSPGNYSLKVQTERLGCTGYGTIEIGKDCFVDIPNAFTPNGDGLNDYFFPGKWLRKGVSQFHLQVFNRWGQLIYETRAKEGLGWDGKGQRIEQPGGVYIYRMDVSYINGRTEQYEGNVNLMR